MLIEIGKVLKPQGVKGELKVMPYIDDARLKQIGEVIINNKSFNVKAISIRFGIAYITLDGVDDRNKALEFHSMSIFAQNEDIELQDDEMFIQDLLGMTVIIGEEDYGQVLSIEQYGSADVVTIQGRFGKWQFPYLYDLVEKVDKENKRIYLNKERFDEVCV